MQNSHIKIRYYIIKFYICRNYSALSNFKGHLDPELVDSINPFWLDFPPAAPGTHYTLGAIYSIMMVLGLSGNALVIFMYIR